MHKRVRVHEPCAEVYSKQKTTQSTIYREVPNLSTGCLYMNIIIPVQKCFRSELFDDQCRSHGACSIDFSLEMYCTGTVQLYCTGGIYCTVYSVQYRTEVPEPYCTGNMCTLVYIYCTICTTVLYWYQYCCSNGTI